MLLAADIGNSDITVGLHDGSAWVHVWRLPSAPGQEVFYSLRLREYFLEADLSTAAVTRSIVSSVVPAITAPFSDVITSVFGRAPDVAGPELYRFVPLRILNPYEIGSDLVANAVAAWHGRDSACVVVDFGTALTFTTITPPGEIRGVAIAPGLGTALKALSANTAKLFEVPLAMPASPLGRNTTHAIQAGLLFGYEGMVINMLRRIAEELGPVRSVGTGGMISVIPTMQTVLDEIRPNLTLDGLRLLSQYARAAG